jgi:signal transduction histidine kinase
MFKRGQTIEFNHQGPCKVMMDKSLLRKVLINLISNAIKFSPEDATIVVGSAADDDCFSIAVKDQGMGISENDLKHLFERFFRGANALNIQGTGLGLHIVAKYVELMNGKINIDSKLGEGTSIHLVFYPHSIPPQLETEDALMNNKSDFQH